VERRCSNLGPTQSHISPSILVYDDNRLAGGQLFCHKVVATLIPKVVARFHMLTVWRGDSCSATRWSLGVWCSWATQAGPPYHHDDKWIRTIRLSIKNSFSVNRLAGGQLFCDKVVAGRVVLVGDSAHLSSHNTSAG